MAWCSREIGPLVQEMQETRERTAKQVARLPQPQQQQATLVQEAESAAK